MTFVNFNTDSDSVVVLSNVDSTALSHVDSTALSHVDSTALSNVDSTALSNVDSTALSNVDSTDLSHVDSTDLSHVDSTALAYVDSAACHTFSPKGGMQSNYSVSATYAIWILSIIFAALLNITLFGLMPELIKQMPGKKELSDSFSSDIFQVVRIKQSEYLPEKKEIKRVEPEVVKPRKLPPEKVKKPEPPRTIKVKQRLPFELNPSLPSFSNSLAMPPLEHFSMDMDAPVVVEPQSLPEPDFVPSQSLPSLEIPPLKSQYGMGELDAPLTPLVKTPPVYPMRAMRRGIEGAVRIRFKVDTQGRVNEPEIVEANPAKIFDASVLKCVMQWRFKPGTVQGVAVNTLVETTIRFQLEK
ncbi:TonB-like protein (modular protein) [Desulfamplus magnetovallimortis]|uniref:TonB-like protein (Modular protein) n=1 Tax=Desulfamplus magnetovallimortis TaxID=1246637 RepID=A0A1W1HBC7_9BACT|nr:energy transducer TonB [Desulfamplus magnetovallimortis]SLM29695.1 TonB-like protein (modular protein) [Desulfamplus magnetovallimortis]